LLLQTTSNIIGLYNSLSDRAISDFKVIHRLQCDLLRTMACAVVDKTTIDIAHRAVPLR